MFDFVAAGPGGMKTLQMYVDAFNTDIFQAYCLQQFLVLFNYLFYLYLGDSLSTVERYDPLLNKWSIAEDMKTVRSRVGVAVLNGRQLYLIYNPILL